MQIILNLADGLVARLLHEASLSGLSLEDYIDATLKDDVGDTKLTTPTGESKPTFNVDVRKLHAVLLNNGTTEKSYLVEDIFEMSYPEYSWTGLHPNNRKQIGRTLAQLIREHPPAHLGQRFIKKIGTTVQNRTLYGVYVGE